jgi:hypothetical protein
MPPQPDVPPQPQLWLQPVGGIPVNPGLSNIPGEEGSNPGEENSGLTLWGTAVSSAASTATGYHCMKAAMQQHTQAQPSLMGFTSQKAGHFTNQASMHHGILP